MQVKKVGFVLVLALHIISVSIQASQKKSEQAAEQKADKKIDQRFSILTEGFGLLDLSLQNFMVDKNAGHWPFEMITAPSGEQQSRLELMINEAEVFMITAIQKRLQNGLSSALKGRVDATHLAMLHYATSHQEFFGKKLSQNNLDLKTLIATTAAELEKDRVEYLNFDER